MGSPTSDDDPTRRVGEPGGWAGPPPPHQPGQYPQPGAGSGYPPPGQGGGYPPAGQGSPWPPPGQGPAYPGPDDPTTRLPQPEEQRGQTAQFPPVGAYPPGPYPPGPGGPPYPPQGPQGAYGYGGVPGGPPPGAGRSRRGLVIALIVALVVLAAIGIALFLAFTRDDGRTVASDPSTSTNPAPTSSEAAPSPSESTSSAPPPSEPAGDRTDELLAAVPVDFTDCAGADLAGDGDVAAVDCGASATQPGPSAASFYLYDDTATLDRVFTEDAAEIEPLPEGEDCLTAQGVTVWTTPDGAEGGQVACTVDDNGLLIAWTDREFGIEGVVTAAGSTQEELATLVDWWRANSDFRR